MKEHIATTIAVFLGVALCIALPLYLANLDNIRWIRLQRRVKIRPRRR